MQEVLTNARWFASRGSWYLSGELSDGTCIDAFPRNNSIKSAKYTFLPSEGLLFQAIITAPESEDRYFVNDFIPMALCNRVFRAIYASEQDIYKDRVICRVNIGDDHAFLCLKSSFLKRADDVIRQGVEFDIRLTRKDRWYSIQSLVPNGLEMIERAPFQLTSIEKKNDKPYRYLGTLRIPKGDKDVIEVPAVVYVGLLQKYGVQRIETDNLEVEAQWQHNQYHITTLHLAPLPANFESYCKYLRKDDENRLWLELEPYEGLYTEICVYPKATNAAACELEKPIPTRIGHSQNGYLRFTGFDYGEHHEGVDAIICGETIEADGTESIQIDVWLDATVKFQCASKKGRLAARGFSRSLAKDVDFDASPPRLKVDVTLAEGRYLKLIKIHGVEDDHYQGKLIYYGEEEVDRRIYWSFLGDIEGLLILILRTEFLKFGIAGFDEGQVLTVMLEQNQANSESGKWQPYYWRLVEIEGYRQLRERVMTQCKANLLQTTPLAPWNGSLSSDYPLKNPCYVKLPVESGIYWLGVVTEHLLRHNGITHLPGNETLTTIFSPSYQWYAPLGQAIPVFIARHYVSPVKKDFPPVETLLTTVRCKKVERHKVRYFDNRSWQNKAADVYHFHIDDEESDAIEIDPFVDYSEMLQFPGDISRYTFEVLLSHHKGSKKIKQMISARVVEDE